MDTSAITTPRYKFQQKTQVKYSTRKLGMVLAGIITMVYFTLPMYVFPSGGFQPVDIPISISIVAGIFFLQKMDDVQKKIISALMFFLVWATAINLGYLLATKSLDFLYNLLALLLGGAIIFVFSNLFLIIINQKKFILLYLLILLSIVGTLCVTGLRDYGTRFALSFNNPNQLAFFAITLLCYVILIIDLKERMGINNLIYMVFDVLIILLANLYIALSISRGALVAGLILNLCCLKIFCKNIKMFLVSSLLIILGLAALIYYKPDFFQERMEARREGRYEAGSMTADLKQRTIGNFRDWGGIQILIGAGKGFSDEKIQQLAKLHVKIQEVHNIFGDVLMSFGIIGLAIFSYWIITFISKSKYLTYRWWIWIPILLENAVGTKLRFRIFYLFLAFLLATIVAIKNMNDQKDNIIDKNKMV